MPIFKFLQHLNNTFELKDKCSSYKIEFFIQWDVIYGVFELEAILEREMFFKWTVLICLHTKLLLYSLYGKLLSCLNHLQRPVIVFHLQKQAPSGIT